MLPAFDERIVQVSLEFEEGVQTFEGLAIYATGRKFDGAMFSECDCKIYNLTADQRNYILSRTSPLALRRNPIKFYLDVGRKSYGTFRLFDGYVKFSGTTQPPDICVNLTSLTNSFLTGVLVYDTYTAVTKLSVIAGKVASNNNLILDFQATDKKIYNYTYNGSAAYQIRDLNAIGGIIANIDGGVLTVRDADKTNNNKRILNQSNGMVGIPQFTDRGINVRMMIDNTIKLGTLLTIESNQLPAANGDYVVQKIFFEVANRDQPFFYTLDCRALKYYAGTL